MTSLNEPRTVLIIVRRAREADPGLMSQRSGSDSRSWLTRGDRDGRRAVWLTVQPVPKGSRQEVRGASGARRLVRTTRPTGRAAPRARTGTRARRCLPSRLDGRGQRRVGPDASPSGSATDTGGGPLTAPKHHVSGAPHREDRRDTQECGPALFCSPRVGRSLAVVERSSLRRADGSTTLHASRDRGTHSAAGVPPARVPPRRVRPRRDGGLLERRVRAARPRPPLRCEVPTQDTTRTVFLATDVHATTEVVASAPLGGGRVGGAPARCSCGGAPPCRSVRRTGRVAVGEPLHVIGHPGDSPRNNVLDLRAVGPSGPGSVSVG